MPRWRVFAQCWVVKPNCLPQAAHPTAAFIAPTGAQVLELGPINATIHKVDEQVLVADIDTLTDVYQKVIERLLLE